MANVLPEGPDDIEEALRLIRDAANAYRGPHAREFNEIARRCMPDPSEDAPEDGGEAHGDILQLQQRRNPGQTAPTGQRESRLGAKERFAEVLALLSDIAFPPDVAVERVVREELGEVLGVEVRSLSFVDGDQLVPMTANLRRTPHLNARELRAAIQQFIPGSDRLYD